MIIRYPFLAETKVNGNVGNYEFLRVGSVSGATVTFAAPKEKYYGQNVNDDTNIGSGATQQHVVLQRIPNYDNVTVSGTLTASAWNGAKNGILAFRVAGTLNGTGVISADALGYANAETYVGAVGGYGAGGSGGIAINLQDNESGGGGGYGTDGVKWGRGAAGKAYHEPSLVERIFFGSGGGNGGSMIAGGTTWNGGAGGRGGGILLIGGNTIDFSGTIKSNGGNAANSPFTNIAPGSGSGGSIRIDGYDVTLSTMSANGGSDYADGGIGRMAIYYYNLLSGAIPSAAYVQDMTP